MSLGGMYRLDMWICFFVFKVYFCCESFCVVLVDCGRILYLCEV